MERGREGRKEGSVAFIPPRGNHYRLKRVNFPARHCPSSIPSAVVERSRSLMSVRALRSPSVFGAGRFLELEPGNSPFKSSVKSPEATQAPRYLVHRSS